MGKKRVLFLGFVFLSHFPFSFWLDREVVFEFSDLSLYCFTPPVFDRGELTKFAESYLKERNVI